MPAVAIAPLELEDEAQSAPASPAAVAAAPTPEPSDDNMEWRHVATYTERFKGTGDATQSRVRRRVLRRHKHFVVSGVTAASALVFLELLGLVWLRALDLKAMRQASDLDKSIALSNEGIARTQKKIAALNSSPHLTKWATDLGYRPANMADFDDVTKNEPMPASDAETPEEVH
jgi:hypothetical protein